MAVRGEESCQGSLFIPWILIGDERILFYKRSRGVNPSSLGKVSTVAVKTSDAVTQDSFPYDPTDD